MRYGIATTGRLIVVEEPSITDLIPHQISKYLRNKLPAWLTSPQFIIYENLLTASSPAIVRLFTPLVFSLYFAEIKRENSRTYDFVRSLALKNPASLI